MQDGVGGLTTQIQNRYTHGGQVDEPLSLEVFDAGGTLDQAYTYHADHLGSIRFVTDSVGTIVNAYEYDSYGRPGFELEQVSQPFRYTGREWDQATELYHYRARQYDPETGRFLQEDPLGFLGGDLNIYRYVGNDPIGFTDPTGTTAFGRVGTNKVGLMASSGQAALGVRLACTFGNIAGLVETATLAASGNVVGASISGVSSVTSCGGAKVTFSGVDAAENILKRQVSDFNPLGLQGGKGAKDLTGIIVTNHQLLRSLVKNSRLDNAIKQLFKRNSLIGNGGTADAFRLTGTHKQKVTEWIQSMKNIMNEENLSMRDKAVARTLLRDLRHAIRHGGP